MIRKLTAAMALVLCTRLCVAAGDANPAYPDMEKAIQQSLMAGQYVDAIHASGDYEVALHNTGQTATFDGGNFSSDELRISFAAPFAEKWDSDDTTGASKADLARSGVQLLLGRKSADGTEQIRMIALDMKAQYRRAGLNEKVNSQVLQDTAKGISQELGTLQDERLDTVGTMNVARLTIGGPDFVANAAAFDHDGEIYFVFVRGPIGSKTVPSDRIDKIVASVKFTALAKEIADRVAAIETAPGTAAEDLLPRVRELANMGQNREAILELLDVRSDMMKRLPAPKVTDDKVTYAGYGLTVNNPDAGAWKCAANNIGAVRMIQLVDKNSAVEGFVGVLVMDPVLSFGPMIAKDLQPGAPEAASKRMLSKIGEGSLNNIARPIIKEQFRTFHGLPAYEGIVGGHNAAGQFQMKLLAVMGPKATYEIMIYGSPDDIEKYTGVAEANIQIEGAADAAPVK